MCCVTKRKNRKQISGFSRAQQAVYVKFYSTLAQSCEFFYGNNHFPKQTFFICINFHGLFISFGSNFRKCKKFPDDNDIPDQNIIPEKKIPR
jgi:hypothetical protein